MGKKDFKKKSSIDEESKVEASSDAKNTKVDAPEARYQAEQQVNAVADTNKTETADSSYIPKKTKSSGGELKQEVASRIVTSKGFGAAGSDVATANSYGFKSNASSGNGHDNTFTGNMAGTPFAGKSYAGGSRVEKKLSDPNKDINFLASEQVLVEYDNIPTMAENPSSLVGMNGTPKNNSLRLQKCTGATAAEDLFDRSLDYLITDEMLFTAGQTVKQAGVTYNDYPTETAEGKSFDVTSNSWTYPEWSMTRGNYAPRELVVTLSKDDDGVFVKSFKVTADDISCNYETADTVNAAATHEKIFLNQTELIRQDIDNKCGSPTSEHFNPLGRSVNQPSQTVALLHDIESTNGATIYTALRCALKARSYYLFRTCKDGQDITSPGIDALYGHLMPFYTSKDQVSAFNADRSKGASDGAFKNIPGIKSGSAALLMALWDSMGKYNNKADIANQARGLKMALQTGLNAYKPFKVYPDFVKALNDVDVFSTIDRGYDPMAPICATDGIQLIYPYNPAEMFGFTKESSTADRQYVHNQFSYDYAAGNGVNRYTIKITDPILAGIAYFFDLNAWKLYSNLANDGDDTKDRTIHIPMTHYGLHFGLYDYLILASLPYIIYERTNVMKDILDLEENYGYPFVDLVGLDSVDPASATQYSGLGMFTPLTVGQMLDSTAFRWIMGEHCFNITDYTLINDDYVMMPWYISSAAYDLKDGELTYNGGKYFNTPVIRSGLRLANLTKFFNEDAEARLLTLDRVVDLPIQQRISGGSTSYTPYTSYAGKVYKYNQDGDGILCIKKDAIKDVTLADYYATPRQLGWMIHPLSRSVGCDYSTDSAADDNFSAVLSWNKLTFFSTAPDMKAVMYKNYNYAGAVGTLDVGVASVNRGQNFTQCWVALEVGRAEYADFDLSLTLNDFMDYGKTESYYTPFISTDLKYVDGSKVKTNVDTDIHMFSFHHQLWTILQKLPFVINPFDWMYDSKSNNNVDPFCICYVFGLAGWMAADYEELDYDRINQVQEQSYGYTHDPFVAKSPLFR